MMDLPSHQELLTSLSGTAELVETQFGGANVDQLVWDATARLSRPWDVVKLLRLHKSF
jgi:hypothetical protein